MVFTREQHNLLRILMIPDLRKSDFQDEFTAQPDIFSSSSREFTRIWFISERDRIRIVTGSKRGNLKGVNT